MTLYEIDKQIFELLTGSVDEETGEVLIDESALEALQMEREQKLENIALFYKDLSAEADAIRAEEQKLAKRRKTVEAHAERLKGLLEKALNGERFKTAKVVVSYRKSVSVNAGGEFIEWAKQNRPELLRYKEPEADKTAIKDSIKSGEQIPFVEIEERNSLSVK